MMSYWKVVAESRTPGLIRKLKAKSLSYDKSTHFLTASHLPLAVFVRGQSLRIVRYDFFTIRKDPKKQVLVSTEYEFTLGHWTSAKPDGWDKMSPLERKDFTKVQSATRQRAWDTKPDWEPNPWDFMEVAYLEGRHKQSDDRT